MARTVIRLADVNEATRFVTLYALETVSVLDMYGCATDIRNSSFYLIFRLRGDVDGVGRTLISDNRL